MASKKPKKIINDPTNAVSEVIQGLLLQYPNRLVKLENHDVLFKQDIEQCDGEVQVLSGGGSGHEPSHAGWIGSGMLSGAILGGIFASPSVASILAAIRAASCGAKNPVLLVVKNYTGDRLNFGMACERANTEGISCQMIVVADDVALERTKGIIGARGVAGTVLVHKVAGATAAKGKSLQEVAEIAQTTAKHMGTLGIALDAVTVPGATSVNDRLDKDDIIEVGLGIHGEAGKRQSKLLTADEMAKEMVSTIQNYGRVAISKDGSESMVPLFESGDNLCVLVNNLGGSSNFEMSLLANAVVSLLENDCTVSRVLVGSFMTAFDMHGASVTILNLSAVPSDVVELLDSDTNALAWPQCDIWKDMTKPRPSLTQLPEVSAPQDKKHASRLQGLSIENFGTMASSLVTAGATDLAAAEPTLTKYDTIVGDGDCGITMKRGADQVLERLGSGSLGVDHPVTLFDSLANAVSDSMGGTSGVLLELMFRKMSSHLAQCDTAIGVRELCSSFASGVDAVCLYGGASAGSRTMLDALIPAAKSLVSSQNIGDAANKARSGADATAAMKLASAGRSSYLSEESLRGTPDPGAVAVAIVFEAFSKSL